MRDEEQPVSRQPFPQARVVDGGHDGLARAGRGDEQVPVSVEGPRQFDLFEEPFLEREQHDLDRTEQDRLLRSR